MPWHRIVGNDLPGTGVGGESLHHIHAGRFLEYNEVRLAGSYDRSQKIFAARTTESDVIPQEPQHHASSTFPTSVT